MKCVWENRFFTTAVAALGIFCCYIIYGGLQERITTIPYGKTESGENGDIFQADNVLVFLQCVAHSIYASLGSYLSGGNTDRTPRKNYAFVALTYLGGMLSSYAALDFISFPTTVIVKSCKMIPVMIMGSFFGKRYTSIEYVRMILVAFGVSLVMLKELPDVFAVLDSVSETTSVSLRGDHLLGVILTLTSLSFDGLTGALQDSFVQVYKPSINQLMFGINIFSSAYLLAGLATLARSEVFFAIQFIRLHPEILWHIGAFCLISCIGQTFIFFAVTTLGSLACSLVTTTRKLFTVLLSVFIVGHRLSPTQLTGVVLVFSGLLWDATSSKSGKRPAVEKEKAS